MRVRRINIQSFGALSGFHADVSGPNMVVIYGDNEAGKSTIAEFLRSTIFPGKNGKYPIPRKTDGGIVELVMDDGGTRVLQREQKRVVERDGKLMPSAELHIDAETYRSLFGLDLEYLGNDKLITTGDLKRRFLTVPGGENVPEVSRIIRAEMDTLMTKERVTETKIIGKYRKESKRLEQEIADKEESLGQYNNLVGRLNDLKEELIYIRDVQDTANYVRNKEIMLETLKENMADIETMKAERVALEYAESLTDEEVTLYDQLKARLESLEKLYEEADDEDDDSGPMSMATAEEILAMKDDIENVWGLKTRLDILNSSVEDLRALVMEDNSFIVNSCATMRMSEDSIRSIGSDPMIHEILINPRKKRVVSAKFVKLFSKGKRVIYSLVALGGVLAGFVIQSPLLASVSVAAGIAVNVTPSIIDAYFHIDNIDWATWIPEMGFPAGTTREQAAELLLKIDSIYDRIRRRDRSLIRMDEFRNESEAITESVYAVLRAMNIDTGNVFGDLNEMYGRYSLATMTVNSAPKSDGLAEKIEQTEKEFKSLIDRYGGEEKFLKACDDREKLRRLDLKLETLIRAVDTATVKVDGMVNKSASTLGNEEDIEMGEEQIKDKIDEINQEIGHVTAEMAAIRGDESIEELKFERTIQNERYVEASKRWAVLSLADTIINECCDHFYSRLQPTVVRTANRYLSLMTNGRYQIITDPRSSDLTIEDRNGRKSLTEWSSGLGDQVLLSVKMAIAKELTDESVPFIMDDVLVRFDRERKQGACRAIMEFAKDQQVIMFTCDRYLESAFKLEGDIKYLEI